MKETLEQFLKRGGKINRVTAHTERIRQNFCKSLTKLEIEKEKEAPVIGLEIDEYLPD